MSTKYDEYLKTDYWKAVSAEVKKRADYRCQLCNSQHDLSAHHRTYAHRGNELKHLDDLTCLCRRCHEIFHGKQAAPVFEEHVRVTRPHKEKKGHGEVDLAAVEADMPPGDGNLVLTLELVNRCRTLGGAFTNAALRPLGVTPPLRSGWPARLAGKTVTRAEYRQALEGRYIYNTGKLAKP